MRGFEDRTKAIRAGFQNYLSKPVDRHRPPTHLRLLEILPEATGDLVALIGDVHAPTQLAEDAPPSTGRLTMKVAPLPTPPLVAHIRAYRVQQDLNASSFRGELYGPAKAQKPHR
jgi:hypothetical protein